MFLSLTTESYFHPEFTMTKVMRLFWKDQLSLDQIEWHSINFWSELFAPLKVWVNISANLFFVLFRYIKLNLY